MGTLFWDIWPFLLALIQFGGMAGAAIHVMLTKTDERAAAGWVGFVVLVPFIGWIIYLLFGVNRIQRRARELRGQKHDMLLLAPLPAKAEERAAEGVVRLRELEGLARFGQKILPESFAQGNAVGVLLNGDEAYPSMLEAISRAERSIAISTYIFDEVDTGIGGSTADMVGEKIAKTSLMHQVLCITHLPQIASRSHHHYLVEKTLVNGRTQSMIRPLDTEERVSEIARMLSGTRVTARTLEAAREMLGVLLN